MEELNFGIEKALYKSIRYGSRTTWRITKEKESGIDQTVAMFSYTGFDCGDFTDSEESKLFEILPAGSVYEERYRGKTKRRFWLTSEGSRLGSGYIFENKKLKTYHFFIQIEESRFIIENVKINNGGSAGGFFLDFNVRGVNDDENLDISSPNTWRQIPSDVIFDVTFAQTMDTSTIRISTTEGYSIKGEPESDVRLLSFSLWLVNYAFKIGHPAEIGMGHVLYT